jgi:UDP-N-acetylmuramoyl-tripeptide--D-alanyl-D-alanine ligase
VNRLSSHIITFGSDLFERCKPTVKRLYKRPLTGLAYLHRSTLKNTVFIGVTGSCGKTTTKDLVDAALGQCLLGSKSQDSNNQLYAVTRTLLSLKRGSDYCVQEIGASGPGSLDSLLRLLRPSIGIITNIGSDHFKAFRDIEATASEKGKLIESLPADGTAILNADDSAVLALASRFEGNVVTFGRATEAHIRADGVSSAWPNRLSFNVTYAGVRRFVQTRLCGEHWVSSVLAAMATAVTMEVPLDGAIKAIEQVDPWLGRMSPMKSRDGVTFIRDDWKASLWSVPSALEFVRSAHASRKIIIIGTLTDYGGTSRKKYISVARHALDVADYVFFVGKHAGSAMRLTEGITSNRLKAFTDIAEANDFIQDFLKAGDLVMIKATNSDHLARLALARDRAVTCWRSSCNRTRVMCDRCILLALRARNRSSF